MPDREKVIKGLEHCMIMCKGISHNPCDGCEYHGSYDCADKLKADALSLLKEQEKKEITLHKKHVITWKRDDEFTTMKLYEAVCETLIAEGKLIIVRIDDHEKVDFTFYVTQESI